MRELPRRTSQSIEVLRDLRSRLEEGKRPHDQGGPQASLFWWLRQDDTRRSMSVLREGQEPEGLPEVRGPVLAVGRESEPWPSLLPG